MLLIQNHFNFYKKATRSTLLAVQHKIKKTQKHNIYKIKCGINMSWETDTGYGTKNSKICPLKTLVISLPHFNKQLRIYTFK